MNPWRLKWNNRRLEKEGEQESGVMAAVGFQDSQKSSMNFSLSLDKSTDDDLCQRIEEYKNDNPDEVEELKRCIHDVLGEAERTAQERLDKRAVSITLSPKFSN